MYMYVHIRTCTCIYMYVYNYMYVHAAMYMYIEDLKAVGGCCIEKKDCFIISYILFLFLLFFLLCIVYTCN